MELPIISTPPRPGQTADSLTEQVRRGASPPSEPLPATKEEMQARGWDEVDVVFVTGDAYIDHPSFAMAILGRVLEAAGFRVGIVSQPDWQIVRRLADDSAGRGCSSRISAGNMDSMINHYTANRKVRNDDAYSPGGRIGLRPDRATLAYCQRAREAYKGVPVIAGGVEASLRRLAHYDYWSDKVRRSILLDCKADFVVYGMGEDADRRNRPASGRGRDRSATCATCAASPTPWARPKRRRKMRSTLPSYRSRLRATKPPSPKRRG